MSPTLSQITERLLELERREKWAWRLAMMLMVMLSVAVAGLWGPQELRVLAIWKRIGLVLEIVRATAPALVCLVVVFCPYLFFLQRAIHNERSELSEARFQHELRNMRSAVRAARGNGNGDQGQEAPLPIRVKTAGDAHLLIAPNDIDIDAARRPKPNDAGTKPPTRDPEIDPGRATTRGPKVVSIDPDLVRFDGEASQAVTPAASSEPPNEQEHAATALRPAASAPVIDREAALAYAKGQVSLLRQVANLYWEESPRHLDEVCQGLASEDAYRAQRYAYRLKDQLGRLGGRAASEVAERLGNFAAADDLSAARAVLPDLQFEIQRFETQLAAILESGGSGEARAA